MKRLLDVFGAQQKRDEVCPSQRIIDESVRHDSAKSSNLAQESSFPIDFGKQVSFIYLRATCSTYG
jgi:hypothetical protein